MNRVINVFLTHLRCMTVVTAIIVGGLSMQVTGWYEKVLVHGDLGGANWLTHLK